MAETVLVTELQFRKAEAVFRAETAVEIRTAPAEEAALAEAVLAAGCRMVVLGVERYTGPLYEALGRTGGPRGALVARFGVGHDGVDKARCKRHNILLANTPGVLDDSVAELTLGLMLALARRVARLDAAVRAGRFVPQMGAELRGKTLGILGFGAIGRRVAAMAHAGLGMTVAAFDSRSVTDLEGMEGRSFEQIKAACGLELYTDDAAAVLGPADVVSVHLAATAQTRHFVDAALLGRMKAGAMLVNTARGSIVDESALYDALAAGRLAGAALDVYESEPYQPAAPGKDLRTLENVVLTPHIGSNTRESNDRMARACLENIHHFLAGRRDKMTTVNL